MMAPSPRRLNIERRRKRIRHYTARRRRRSPVRRAFAFWWSSVAVGLVAVALMGSLAVAMARRVVRREARPLPAASLRLAYASPEAISEVVRSGNVRRRAMALDDAAIGLSLASTLPEPPPRVVAPLPPLPKVLSAVGAESTAGSLLPPAAPAKCAVEVGLAKVRLTPSLQQVKFEIPVVPEAEEPASGCVQFAVALDAGGRPVTVLRMVPTGAESDWHRALRVAVTTGRGTGAARGIVTIYWHSEENP